MLTTHTTALEFAREQFALDPAGPHGESHWSSVSAVGRHIGEAEGADPEVIDLFALFHDLCRVGDGVDRGHGHRAAELARHCRGVLFDIDEDRFGTLWAALSGHDRREADHRDVTVRVCWDAERLELPRFGITPQPSLLYTETARRPGTMAWAAERCRPTAVPIPPPSAWSKTLMGRS